MIGKVINQSVNEFSQDFASLFSIEGYSLMFSLSLLTQGKIKNAELIVGAYKVLTIVFLTLLSRGCLFFFLSLCKPAE